MAAAAALKTHLLRQSADDHHVRILRNREYPVVFQQDGAFAGKLLCNLVGVRRILFSLCCPGAYFFTSFSILPAALAISSSEISPALSAAFSFRAWIPVTVRAFPGPYPPSRLSPSPRGAPVGNDHPVKAPFLPENFVSRWRFHRHNTRSGGCRDAITVAGRAVFTTYSKALR